MDFRTKLLKLSDLFSVTADYLLRDKETEAETATFSPQKNRLFVPAVLCAVFGSSVPLAL